MLFAPTFSEAEQASVALPILSAVSEFMNILLISFLLVATSLVGK